MKKMPVYDKDTLVKLRLVAYNLTILTKYFKIHIMAFVQRDIFTVQTNKVDCTQRVHESVKKVPLFYCL